jgi:hypothetical protein
MTGSDGSCLFPVLPVGTYQLTAEKTAFTKYIQSGIVWTLNQAANQPVVLHVGGFAQQVTVTSNASLTTIAHRISRQQIVDLPLYSRHAELLVFLVPGSTNSTNHCCIVNCKGNVIWFQAATGSDEVENGMQSMD